MDEVYLKLGPVDGKLSSYGLSVVLIGVSSKHTGITGIRLLETTVYFLNSRLDIWWSGM